MRLAVINKGDKGGTIGNGANARLFVFLINVGIFFILSINWLIKKEDGTW